MGTSEKNIAQLPLPPNWEWSDYDKPTICSSDGISGMDGMQHEKYHRYGTVPRSAGMAFFVRRMQIHQKNPDGPACREIVHDLLETLIQLEESHDKASLL